MKKIFCMFAVLAGIVLSGQDKVQTICDNGMKELSPGVRDHLTLVIHQLELVPTGKTILEKVSPDVSFTAKPLRQLGVADQNNRITLEALRLKENELSSGTDRLAKTKICFTAEILSHELLHNAQFHAGLFDYPSGCSGYECVLFEKMLELQAKYTGETVFNELRRLEEYQGSVQEKPGVLAFARLTAKDPAKEYMEILWKNDGMSSGGTRLFLELKTEVFQWNRAYAEQAFRNNWRKFLSADGSERPETAFAEHLTKIIKFTGMPMDPDFIAEYASVKPIPHGIACYEAGQKVMEFTAEQTGYRKREFTKSGIRESVYRFR